MKPAMTLTDLRRCIITPASPFFSLFSLADFIPSLHVEEILRNLNSFS